MKFFIRIIHIIFSKTNILVGGQAVIEGVMMRVPGFYATSVRKPDGNIESKREDFISITATNKILSLPVIRGMVHLFESLRIGFRTLQWSADMSELDQPNNNKFVDIAMNVVAICIGIGIFFILPLFFAYLTDTANGQGIENNIIYNLVSGLFRIIIFLIYLSTISLSKDVRTLFQYHGAEHKVVYNFESGNNLNISNAREFPTHHPRCGSSFVFIVMFIGIIIFTCLDTTIVYLTGIELTVLKRILIHIPAIPLVAGVSYEFLKLSAKHSNNIILKLLSLPGLWLQNITTKEPDDKQLEVSLHALQAAFGDDIEKFKGQQFTADAIG